MSVPTRFSLSETLSVCGWGVLQKGKVRLPALFAQAALTYFMIFTIVLCWQPLRHNMALPRGRGQQLFIANERCLEASDNACLEHCCTRDVEVGKQKKPDL